MPDWGLVNDAIEAAASLAREACEDAGLPATAVVVNVAWREGREEWAAASRTPPDAPPILADSLAQSAEDAR